MSGYVCENMIIQSAGKGTAQYYDNIITVKSYLLFFDRFIAATRHATPAIKWYGFY